MVFNIDLNFQKNLITYIAGSIEMFQKSLKTIGKKYNAKEHFQLYDPLYTYAIFPQNDLSISTWNTLSIYNPNDNQLENCPSLNPIKSEFNLKKNRKKKIIVASAIVIVRDSLSLVNFRRSMEMQE